ncbi:CASP-like protein 1F1 [Coffea arabica]|uniref:CASP-like protein n=1 Tax=Coffea arabica TaxID=13443 RepID=A0A6P6X181_COFAR|nr:CASP-like protein 1F1 [Coffea arabica]
MENVEAKHIHNSTLKTHKLSFMAQICLRLLATVATLAAAWIILTSKQTVAVFGMVVDARYSYSPAFKFFAYANVIVCAVSALSLLLLLVISYKSLVGMKFFYFFLHDLMVVTLLMAGCAAATAIGYVGQHGNSHTGWMPICDDFGKFCRKVAISVALSYFGVMVYLLLTIISAVNSRWIQV